MYDRKRPSRVITGTGRSVPTSPRAQSVIFETYWDYLAFALGIIFGSFAFGFAIKVYLFGL